MPYIKVDGKNIYYKIKGKSNNTLLFLHCWTCNHTFWEQQVQSLTRQYKCIMIDLPGHGLSDEIEDYSIAEFSRYINAVISKLNVKNAVVIGHSLGGMIALQLATDHPSKVRALILIDTSAKLKKYLFQNISTVFGIAFGNLTLSSIKMAAFDISAVHPLTGLRIRRIIKNEIVKIPNHIVVKILKCIRAFDAIDSLKDITAPTLIIVGDLDLFTDIRHAWTLYKNIKNSRMRIVRGAGHMSILEQPCKVNRHIKKFLSEVFV